MTPEPSTTPAFTDEQVAALMNPRVQPYSPPTLAELIDAQPRPLKALELIVKAKEDYEALIPMRDELIVNLLKDGCTKSVIARTLKVTPQTLSNYAVIKAYNEDNYSPDRRRPRS